MRKVRTFVDLIINSIECDFNHKRNDYSSIYGKIIYPVASNPLKIKRMNANYNFRQKNRYWMIR